MYVSRGRRDTERVAADGADDGYGLGRSSQNPLCRGSIAREHHLAWSRFASMSVSM